MEREDNPAPPYEALIARLDQLPITVEAEALYDAAIARVRQARSLPNPSIAFGAENAFGSGSHAGYGRADTTISINQPLDLWGQRGARIHAAQAAADVAGLRQQQLRWLAAGRLAQLYAEAEAASRLHDLTVEALSLTEEDASAARALVTEGREATLRGIQAESAVQVARAAVDGARASRDAALARLTAFAMLDEPFSSIAVSLLDRTPSPVGTDLGDSVVLRVAQAELAAAGGLVTVERLRARPAMTASVGLRRLEEFGDEALTFGVSMSLPLFDRNTGAISAAHAERRAAAARLVAQRYDALAEHRAAHASLDAASSRMRAADSGVAAAEEAYRLARIGYEAGRIAQLELLSSRAALVDAWHTAVDVRLLRARAEIDLARLEGRVPYGRTR